MTVTRPITRRRLLTQGTRAFGALGVGLFGGPFFIPASPAAALPRSAGSFGPLQNPDSNGLRLPTGFKSRVVAKTGQPVSGTDHVWHGWPDGGATFPTDDGGWIYVSNAELNNNQGGVSALRFDTDGHIADAYSILTGTSRNCAGGPTPWKTWLSCEEVPRGQVYECSPTKPHSEGLVRPAMGTFAHEAAAVDPVRQCIYLTEDHPSSLLYRFTPTRYPDLSEGVLEAATIVGLPPHPSADAMFPVPQSNSAALLPGQVQKLVWSVISDPTAAILETRLQAPTATTFNGGEGCWYESGLVHFSTKGDNRVWKIDTATDEISVLYDLASSDTPILSGVDNVLGLPNGDVFVAEDGGDLEIVALSPSGQAMPIVQLTGQLGTEITGPAMSPDGSRLYFSSQRHPGITYEVTGPFQAGPAKDPGSVELSQLIGGAATKRSPAQA